MATEEQLLAGLKAADAAGNTADAQHFADQIKAMRAAPAQQSGPQPSIMQTIEASPVGRLAHDLVIGPTNSFLLGAAKKASNAINDVNPGGPIGRIPASFDPIENSYRGALAAQRNRPGYAEEAAKQAPVIGQGHGFTDQVTAPLSPAMAGIAGLLTGGVNGMNAAADAQTGAQQGYQTANPTKAAIGQALGGFMAMPEGTAAGIKPQIGTLLHPINSAPLSPQEQAAAYVQNLMASSKTAPDAASLRSIASNAGGKPVTSAEAIGKPGEVAIGALARREGGTADALAGEMAARQAEAPTRILEDFASSSGIDPTLAKGDIEGYVASGRQTVSPMFKQALAGDQGVWNENLARLSNRPSIQDAMKAVVGDLKEADINPSGLGFTAQDPVTGRFMQKPRPTAQAWDMVKKRLGQSVERDQFNRIIPDSISPGNYNINGTNRVLTSALRDAIPGYGDALDASGDYLSMQKAFGDGQSFILNPKVTSAQVQQHLAGLSPSEAQAFKGGIANKLFDLQQNGRLGAKLADAPSVQQKLALALGKDNASKFLDRLGMEKSMANFARLRTPGAGSPTAEYQAAMASQDAGASRVSPDMIDFAANTVRRGPVSAGISLAAGKAKDAAAAWATRGMPISVRDEAGKLLLMRPDDLATLLSAPARPLAAAPKALAAPAITSASRIPYGVAASLASILASQPAAAQSQKHKAIAEALAQQGSR